MDYKINALYFSATGTTKRVVEKLAEELSYNFNVENINYKDFTLPSGRGDSLYFTKEDIVLVGLPVYAGRLPNVLLNYIKNIKADGAKAVPVVLYGNRDFDDALIELIDILKGNGFDIIAAGAFIGEHSFSKILAKGRPDEKDLAKVADFAKEIYLKLSSENGQEPQVPGNTDYRPYYRSKDKKGNPVDIRKVTPKTKINVQIVRFVYLFVLWGLLIIMMFQN